MAFVTVAELKEVIQTGSIYPDATLQSVCDAAQNILESLLLKNQYAAIAHKRLNSVATVWVDRPHDFYIGQSVTLANCGGQFNGAKTITAINKAERSFSFASAHADYEKHTIVPSGTVTAEQYVNYSTIPEVHQAALAIAVDIWQTQKGSQNQMGVDFQPAPYRLGRSLTSRVQGLLSKWIDTGTMVG